MKVDYLKKLFWEMTFGSVDDLSVYGFLETYIMVVTNKKVYLTFADYEDADFRFSYRDVMIAQSKQGLLNKSFSHQDQDKREDGLQKGMNFSLNYVPNIGEPLTNNVFDYAYNDDGICYFFRGSKYDSEFRDLEKFLTIIDSENNQNNYKRKILQRAETDSCYKQNRRLSY